MAVPVNVYIEGNIAAGKTELLRLFSEKKKYDYLFQTLANTTKLNLLNEHCHKNGIKIIERSLQSGFNVFVKNSRDNYGMDDLTYEALKYNYETMCTNNCLDMITCPDHYN